MQQNLDTAQNHSQINMLINVNLSVNVLNIHLILFYYIFNRFYELTRMKYIVYSNIYIVILVQSKKIILLRDGGMI